MLRGMQETMSRWSFIGALLCFLWAPAGEVFADVEDETGSTLLAQAKILYEDLQYDEALEALREALKVGDMPRRDVIEVYKHMAFIYLIQGEEKYAEASFQLLLQQDPDHRLNPLLTPPRFIEFFEQVKARNRAEAQVLLEHDSPDGFRAGQPLEIVAYMVDRSGSVDRFNVYFRMKGTSSSYSSARLQVDPAEPTRYTGLVPYVFGAQDSSFVVEYYIAAVAPDGEWLATVGDPRSPLDFSVEVSEEGFRPDDDSPSLMSRWWFWAGAAGVAGAAGGGLYFGLQSSPEPPDHGAANLVIR